MSSLISKFVDYLVRINIINKDHGIFYVYYLEKHIISFVCILLLFLIMKGWFNPLHILVFLSSFVYIRSYTGGYHASTPFFCFLYSSIILKSGLHLSLLLEKEYVSLVILGIISFLIILSFSPINHPNIHWSDIEFKEMRKKMSTRLLLLFIISIVSEFFHLSLFCSTIIISLFYTSLSVLLSKLIKQEVSQ